MNSIGASDIKLKITFFFACKKIIILFFYIFIGSMKKIAPLFSSLLLELSQHAGLLSFTVA